MVLLATVRQQLIGFLKTLKNGPMSEIIIIECCHGKMAAV